MPSTVTRTRRGFLPAPAVVEVLVRVVGVRRSGQAGGGESGSAGEDAAAAGEAVEGLDVGVRLVLLERRVACGSWGRAGMTMLPRV